MRIGEVNKDNYMSYLKLFGVKDTKSLDAIVNPSGSLNVQQYDENGNWINPYGEPGMNITGRDPSSNKIVEVSDEIKEKLVNLARSEFLDGYGLSDGEKLSAIVLEYKRSMPEEERINIGWTLQHVYGEEARRIHGLAKENIPGWRSGQPFDRDSMSNLINKASVDLKV